VTECADVILPMRGGQAVRLVDVADREFGGTVSRRRLRGLLGAHQGVHRHAAPDQFGGDKVRVPSVPSRRPSVRALALSSPL
jgi:hypothetical protein